ncbi:hypothetical protein Ahy_B03g062969 isoform B [Arachis hypogaea]|uniref:MalT-like TPR region domain-containing protein n=1 Tax=Arachis hypogaea TaxID=3818 RepID=A0A444ZW93_ARAHY|nr:hypothetical protein Ahy_B03g062969 isoform B [Arachis hypogaea]
MSLRTAAAIFLKRLRFPASHGFCASRVYPNAFPLSFSGKLKLSHWYQTGANGSRMNLRDPCLWIVISGHIAIVLGTGANTVFAEDPTNEASPDDDLIGLRKVEDGSIVSNTHTAKWRGQLDAAEKLFLAALQEAKEGFGPRDPHVASSCNNLAELYRIKKDFAKAEPLYLEAIDILEEAFGPDDIRVGAAAHNLGQFYLGQRKLEKARVSYERALKVWTYCAQAATIKRRVLGYGHSECADTMYHLGVVLYFQGKERDAEAAIQDSIRLLEEGGEGESFVCIRRLRYLSQIYLKSHRLAEAEMVQRKIMHILELSKGWNSLDTVVAAESLALTLQASCNLKDSKELLERIARQYLDRVSKQKDRLKKHSAPGDSRKEAQAALLILLQSFNTLSSVEVAKQELLEIQEGKSNLKAKESLLQCIHAYSEFVADKSIPENAEIKKEYLSCLKVAQNLLGNKGLPEAELIES